MFDLIIKGGRIVDGTGRAAFNGDVAIEKGAIAAIGTLGTDAKQVIDARGRVVAPGFIDPHTHFDVQLLWDGAARPALEHGVTTVVPGNCSLSLAPLKAADRRALVGMFQQIEELPPAAFTDAFEWTWESFGGYVDALTTNARAERGAAGRAQRDPPVGDGRRRAEARGHPRRNPRRCRTCCASVSRPARWVSAPASSTSTRSCTRCRAATRIGAELDALVEVLGEYGRMLQVVPEFYATDLTIARIDQLAELSLKYNIPTTFSPLFDSAATPDNVPRTMARVEEQFARGARVWPQVQTRPIDISFSFERPSLYFGRFPNWYRVMRLPRAERIAALRDAATRRTDGERNRRGRRPDVPGQADRARRRRRAGRTGRTHARKTSPDSRGEKVGAGAHQRLARERSARAVPGRERRPPGRGARRSAAGASAGARRCQRRRRARHVVLDLWRHRLPVQPVRPRNAAPEPRARGEEDHFGHRGDLGAEESRHAAARATLRTSSCSMPTTSTAAKNTPCSTCPGTACATSATASASTRWW